MLVAQGKLDEALARFEQALALRPDFVDAYFHAGNALANQDKVDQAATRFEQAIALRADFAKAHNNLGVCGDDRQGSTRLRPASSA